MVDLNKRINELLNKKGWTVYELSKQTGISSNTIYAWQKGAVPSLGTVLIICEALGITVEQFFCGIESYKLTEDENRILQEWFMLSDLEKRAIFNLIETFKILKRDK